jgi:hypothetical protein
LQHVASHRSVTGLLRTLASRAMTFHRVALVLLVWMVIIPTLLGILADLLLSPLQVVRAKLWFGVWC